jgi:RNA polymerase sigma factor (TIGR02999 family)
MLTGQFEKLAGKLFPGKETADQLLNECRLMTESGEITALLRAWQEGDQGALEPLTQSVHAELRRLAGSAFRGERAGHTLQPTALVNEAFIKLVQADIGWQSRAHFFALSARMMRRLLLDHARNRNAQKRGGPMVAMTYHDSRHSDVLPDERFEDLDDALNRLAKLDKRKADLIELQVFGGLSFRELSEVTGLSSSTLDRELRLARAWLKRELSA